MTHRSPEVKTGSSNAAVSATPFFCRYGYLLYLWLTTPRTAIVLVLPFLSKGASSLRLLSKQCIFHSYWRCSACGTTSYFSMLLLSLHCCCSPSLLLAMCFTCACSLALDLALCSCPCSTHVLPPGFVQRMCCRSGSSHSLLRLFYPFVLSTALILAMRSCAYSIHLLLSLSYACAPALFVAMCSCPDER